MQPRIVGLETEYGLYVEGHGADEQIDDARELVSGATFGRPNLWDYRNESPRADLRGFSVEKLTIDPEDAAFDRGRHYGPSEEVRADRILENGARFYNDHGHPEYATPECLSIRDLVEADRQGENLTLRAARAFAEKSGKEVKVYKNNTDFHGASYGTHENYLVPRSIGFERLYRAVTPLLVARQILCGAGKVGSEHGRKCAYQISQRADFFSEKASVDTLYRRPVFNTRDEPHADPAKWTRLHVIAGDANMIPSATWRKVGLLRLALMLEEIGEVPLWNLKDPVLAFEDVSKDETMRFEIPLEGRSWTTAYEIVESYLAAGARFIPGSTSGGVEVQVEPGMQCAPELAQELSELMLHCSTLLQDLRTQPEKCAPHIDWLAKRSLLEQVMEETSLCWTALEMRSYDLEYHNIDPEESLFHALVAMGQVEATLTSSPPTHHSRAHARGIATRYPELTRANWRFLTFELDAKEKRFELDPERDYSHLNPVSDVVTFIESL